MKFLIFLMSYLSLLSLAQAKLCENWSAQTEFVDIDSSIIYESSGLSSTFYF